MNVISAIKNKKDLITGEPATDERIKNEEIALGTKFAKDYILYTKKFGMIAYDGHELTGVCSNATLDTKKATLCAKKHFKNIPNDYYVLEFLNIDSIIIWQSSNGEIYQSNSNGKVIKIYDSLSDYINS